MSDQNQGPFSFNSKEEFTKAVNEVVHGAISNRLTSFETKMESIVTKASQSKQTVNEETDVEKVTPTKQANKALDEVKLLRDELAKERQINKDKTLKSATQATLTKLGYPIEAQRAAMALLNEDKLVSMDEEGNPRFKGQYEGEYIPLEDGLKSLMKSSPEFKALLPQKQVAGSGDRKYQTLNNTNHGTEVTADDLVDVMNQFRNS